MKKEIHPNIHPVVFVDSATGDEILTKSTITSDEKRDIDGISHYVVYCDITSFTHPFYTGKQKLVDTAGRLQTKSNLMEELSKVRKIIDKLAPEAKVIKGVVKP